MIDGFHLTDAYQYNRQLSTHLLSFSKIVNQVGKSWPCGLLVCSV